MAKKKVVDPDTIWKFEGTAYSPGGIGQMNDVQLLDLHNQLARYLGNEERTSLPSRKLLEGAVCGMLITANHPDTKRAPKGEAPAKGKKKAQPSIPAGSETEDEDTKMSAKTKTAKTAKKTTKAATADRRKPAISKERNARVSYAGKHLSAKVKENPCREGTGRFDALAIIMKKPGISFEDYAAKGGDTFNLRYCIDRGFVSVK